MRNLEIKQALHCSDILRNYFNNLNRIDDYFKLRKIERVKNIPPPLPGFGLDEDMFQSYGMEPEKMDIEVVEMQHSTFNTMLEMIASFSPDQAPGKELKLIVKEKSSNKIVGFIKLGSPIINSKPRNNYLGGTPDLPIFNKRAIMGFNIVPVQPFGFNYLGGKLLALICCSHKVREMLNRKYDTEFCLFETTSLYGNIKGTSMYDGLKPYLRYKGDTMSKFVPTLGEETYFNLKDYIENIIGEDIVHKGASSRKLKITTAIIGMVKRALKGTEYYDSFVKSMAKAEGITTQKRFYMCDYGYSNIKDILLGKTDKLIKGDNYDKFELENLIKWWKNKATKRYNKLKEETKLRTELEIWNNQTMNKIDIIR
jgi:hypothetical protein